MYKEPIIEMPIDNLVPYLNKTRIDIKKPISRKDLQHEVICGCHDVAVLIFSLILYISQVINNKSISPYVDMNERLIPYLPYFVIKDVSEIHSNIFMVNDNHWSIRPKPTSTIDVFERLIEFSREQVVYFNLSQIGANSISHHFCLYNGKICSAWGGPFNVYYVEKEITPDDLMFFMKFNESYSSPEEKYRFKQFVSKYLLDIENFDYPLIHELTHVDDPTPDRKTKRLITEKIIPIISWIFEDFDRIEEDDIEGELQNDYVDINRLILNEWDKIKKIFSKYKVPVKKIGNPEQVIFKEERIQLLDKIRDILDAQLNRPEEEGGEGRSVYEDEIRNKVFDEILGYYRITPENDVDNSKNYREIIEYIKDLYNDGINYGIYQLESILINNRTRIAKPEALELYGIQNRTTEQETRLRNNLFFQRYESVLNSQVKEQVISCILYNDEQPKYLFNNTSIKNYNKTMWVKMFDIINEFTPISSGSISPDTPMLTVYGQRLRPLLEMGNNEYLRLMTEFGGNVDLIVTKLNESYRSMELPVPGEPYRPDPPLLISNTECTECIPPEKPFKSKNKVSRKKSTEPPISESIHGMITRSKRKIDIPESTYKMTTRSKGNSIGGKTKRRKRKHRKTKRNYRKRSVRKYRIK